MTEENGSTPQTEPRGLLAGGRLELDLSATSAWLDGQALTLGVRSFALLLTLMRNPGRLVSKAELIDSVWQGRAVSDAVLTTAVRDLRIALGDDARRPSWIKTEHGQGYRFIADVILLPEQADAKEATSGGSPTPSPAIVTEAVDAPSPADVEPPSADAEERRAPKAGSFARQAAIAAACLIGVVTIWFGVSSVLSRPSPTLERSVAVLDFQSRSADQDITWIADGLAEEITNALTRVPDLRVSSRRAVIGSYEPDTPLEQIGARLGAAHLLDGSVEVFDERVRISVALVKADDGVQLWSERYDRDLGDVLSLQADISAHVADTLDTALDPESLQRMAAAGTQSIAAYEAYLRGRANMAEFARTGDEQPWREALPLFDRARSIDPGFAEAHAASATIFRFLNTPSLVYQRDPVTGEAYRRAYAQRMDAAIAAARTPIDAEGYRAIRDMELFNLSSAREAFAVYVQERRNDIDAAFEYSNTLVMLGLHEEARAIVSDLLDIIPRSDATNRGILIQHATKSRDFALAADLARETLADHPFHGFSLVEGYIALLRAGEIDAAREVAERIAASEVGWVAQMSIELYQACADGDREAAAPLAERLSDHPQAYLTAWQGQRAMGNDDRAYARLLELDRPGSPPPRLRSLLLGDPSFDPARFTHLSQAIVNAGGRIVEPAPALVRCPPAG